MTIQGRSRLRFMGGAALLLVLVAGGLSGAAINRAVTSRAPAVRERDECARFRQDNRRRGGHGYFEYLDLSAEQRERMDAVLEDRKTQLDEFWRENRARMDAIVDGARVELMSILTPEQRAQYDARLERRRAEWMALEERCRAELEQEGQEEKPATAPQGSNGGDRMPTREHPELPEPQLEGPRVEALTA